MIQPRLSQVLKTATGLKFHGIFTDAEDRFDGDDIRARRILRVNERVPISTGDVVSRGTDRYLLFQHSEAEGQKRFLSFQITHTVAWKRIPTVTNSVTQMEESGAEQTLDATLAIVVEPQKIFEDLNIKRVGYTIRTPAGVEPGDTLGEFKVHTVQTVPGACIIGAF